MEDKSGNISASELRNVLLALGYRPMSVVISEVLEEVGFEDDAELNFEERRLETARDHLRKWLFHAV